MHTEENLLIYESPDGGQTIYGREMGKSERVLIRQTPIDPYEQIYLWHDVVNAAKHNPALRALLDEALVLYRLCKDE